jgi:hypothetical protein
MKCSNLIEHPFLTPSAHARLGQGLACPCEVSRSSTNRHSCQTLPEPARPRGSAGQPCSVPSMRRQPHHSTGDHSLTALTLARVVGACDDRLSGCATQRQLPINAHPLFTEIECQDGTGGRVEQPTGE